MALLLLPPCMAWAPSLASLQSESNLQSSDAEGHKGKIKPYSTFLML